MGKLDASAVALGRKIAFHRARRGLSQRDFGAMVDRSETWVSQVERGERRIDRMTVLRQVAEALGVPLSELAADTPIVAEASSRPAPASALRMLLSSSLTLSLAVSRPTSEPATPIGQLQDEADRAWQLAHSADYGELIPLLTELLPQAEAAVRQSSGAAGRRAFRVLARIYHAAAAALVKLNEQAAAWVAADRAIAAAERAGDRLLMGEGVFRLVLVFQAGRQYDQAEQAATTGIEALDPLAQSGTTAAVSLQGALHLQLAIGAARQNSATDAVEHLRQARVAAEVVGVDRNDYNTEFGPTNVMLHEVAVAVELGDPGTALRLAATVEAGQLSPERQGRLLLDVARAHLQRRSWEGAILALLDAERITPEQVRNHWITRILLQDLERSMRPVDERVRGLMERCRIVA